MDENTCRDIIPWLIINRAPGLSLDTAHRLLDEYLSPAGIISLDKRALLSAGLGADTVRFLHAPDMGLIDSDLEWIQQPANYLVHYQHQDYPELLRHISDPPLVLFMAGDVTHISRPRIAIVGSRKPTPGGKKIAHDFAGQLGECGITVTSGLAWGIDSAAHKGAISAGGTTFAVLGNGLDMIYPRSNTALAGEIREKGLLISEFPMKIKPLPHHFPKRNRIISGLSSGVLVVEASMKSGSLITARLAAEQGREVFAVPGTILNPVAEGTNFLIANGAKLTSKIEDIIEEIPLLHRILAGPCNGKSISHVNNEVLDVQVKLLLDNIGYEPVSFDDIVNCSGIQADKLRIMIPEMELENLIESTPCGRFIRK